jgi:uncharacterized protein (TIGR03435 family)
MYPHQELHSLPVRVASIQDARRRQGLIRMTTEYSAPKFQGTRTILLTLALGFAALTPILLALTNPIPASAQTPAAASPQAADTPASPTDIVGTWQGTLKIAANADHPEINLRLVFKISRSDANALKAVWYSIDQGGQPLPVATVSFQDGVLKFKITLVPRSYEGKMSADGKSIAGTWMEDTTPIPLPLARATPETEWTIPTPPPPVPPMAADANPSFEVATIKPSKPGTPGKGFGFQAGHFMTRNTDLNDLIAFAYGRHPKQLIGAPDWFGTDLFDIEAKPDAEGRPSMKQMGTMAQKLLEERFALKFHHEQRELSVYVISVAAGGPKMTKTNSGPNDPPAFFFRALGDLTVRNQNMNDFAQWMQNGVMDRPVVDQTGLTDRYDFQLKWTPDESQFAAFRGVATLYRDHRTTGLEDGAREGSRRRHSHRPRRKAFSELVRCVERSYDNNAVILSEVWLVF